jgi:hypothetical protein
MGMASALDRSLLTFFILTHIKKCNVLADLQAPIQLQIETLRAELLQPLKKRRN